MFPVDRIFRRRAPQGAAVGAALCALITPLSGCGSRTDTTAAAPASGSTAPGANVSPERRAEVERAQQQGTEIGKQQQAAAEARARAHPAGGQ